MHLSTRTLPPRAPHSDPLPSPSSHPTDRLNRLVSSVTTTVSSAPVVALCASAATVSAALCTLASAAPLSHNLPSEAAEPMEGLLHHLPHSVQVAITSSDGFTPAFLQSLLLILACEIGDRTFFVAAILAMKSSRIVVWSGAVFALGAMTVLSAAIGKAFPLLLDKKWTSLAAALLFLYFGVQLLREWYATRNDAPAPSDELAEVESELAAQDIKDTELALAKKSPASPTTSTTASGTATTSTAATTATQRIPSLAISNSNSSSAPTSSKHSNNNNNNRSMFSPLAALALVSPVFAKAFSMTLLAEWGDRSQIATIALAASRDMSGVIVGGVLGHMICTGVAVVGGRLLASSISERAVALMGGLLFVTFAFLTFFGILE